MSDGSAPMTDAFWAIVSAARDPDYVSPQIRSAIELLERHLPRLGQAQAAEARDAIDCLQRARVSDLHRSHRRSYFERARSIVRNLG